MGLGCRTRLVALIPGSAAEPTLIRALAREMSDAFARFVRTGSPNGGLEHPESWPALKSSDGPIRIWDCESRLEKAGTRLGEISALLGQALRGQGEYYNISRTTAGNSCQIKLQPTRALYYAKKMTP